MNNLDNEYNQHHWYGHVQDVSYIDFGNILLWILVLLFVVPLALASGLWVILILIWLFAK